MNKFRVACALLVFAFLVSACNFTIRSPIILSTEAPEPTRIVLPSNTPEPYIWRVMMCKTLDEHNKCVEDVTTFGTTDKIHISFANNNYPDGTTVKAEWHYGDGTLISEYEMNLGGNGAYFFFISPNKAWKTGSAYVTLLVNGNVASTKNFEIK